MEVPKILYHATLEENALSIMVDGIRDSYHGIYMCDSYQDAAKFLMFRAIAENKNIACLKIDTSSLDKDLFVEGTDHSSQFFGNPNVYVYPNAIPPEAIHETYQQYDINDIKQAMNKEK